jgi:hypothetical protein
VCFSLADWRLPQRSKELARSREERHEEQELFFRTAFKALKLVVATAAVIYLLVLLIEGDWSVRGYLFAPSLTVRVMQHDSSTLKSHSGTCATLLLSSANSDVQ